MSGNRDSFDESFYIFGEELEHIEAFIVSDAVYMLMRVFYYSLNHSSAVDALTG